MATFRGLIFGVMLLSLAGQAAELRFAPVNPDVIRARMDRLRKKNPERAAELWSIFEEAGCKGDRLTQPAEKGARSNVVCTLPGQTDEVIVVGGHFDKVERSDGAVDDWSGVSLLPSLYQAMTSLPESRFTWVFVGFAEEETGLNGSRAFVKGLGKEGIGKVRAMINLECLGLSPTKVWANRSDPVLSRAIVAIGAAVKSEVTGMNVDAVGDSDSHSFSEKKIPVLDVHSLTQETWPLLHKPTDSRAAVHDEWHYESYRLVTALLAWLDGHYGK